METQASQKQPASIMMFIDLGIWNLYFLLKLYLFSKGSINFHFLENIAFLLFLIAPLQTKFLYKLRQLIVIPVGFALFYYDSWLPAFGKMLTQLKNMLGFDLSYIAELTLRFINFEMVSALIIGCFAFHYLKNWIKFTSITVTLFIYFSVTEYYNSFPDEATNGTSNLAQSSGNGAQVNNLPIKTTSATPSQQLEQFYQSESQRVINYNETALNQPFELLFLNVCSLSWDDLKHTGLENHVLFEKFDVLFQQFNTATSYSGPAAIRILRASCGQTSHTQLYSEADKQCYLFNNLAQLGFGHELLMNHDGKFDNFEEYIRKDGAWNVENQLDVQTPLIQKSFDGSPIYSDRYLFDSWLASSSSSTEAKATFYNTISLHDGNKILGSQSKLSSLENYHPRLLNLLNDINYLFEKIEQSGRKVMVVLVPEHGAGISGDSLQLAGMREFPSYNVTHVPVGVRLFGTNKPHTTTINVNTPSSHLAISALVQQVVDKDLFGEPTATLSEIVNSLPSTDFVSENDSSTVIQHNGKFMLKVGNEQWVDYPNGK